jgi:hypothetical protein
VGGLSSLLEAGPHPVRPADATMNLLSSQSVMGLFAFHVDLSHRAGPHLARRHPEDVPVPLVSVPPRDTPTSLRY